jgi:hypothetical protein
MSRPIGFFIGISDGYNGIEAIHVELTKELPRDTCHALVGFLNANTEQLVSDINAGKTGSVEYNRVAMKVYELAALLPTERVLLDANFQKYGVDVDYDDLGIPTPLEHPTLVVIFYNKNTSNVRIIYPDQFNTDLYDYLC